MFNRKIKFLLLITTALSVVIVGGCRKAAETRPNAAAAQQSPSPAQNQTIETETVSLQSIAGGILATGKLLVPEDRMAIIGPVNEGRLVRLYAGQGSRVRKGQKLAELESADI